MKDGGPAFPANRFDALERSDGVKVMKEVTYPGMSLRDFFAGLALAGMYSDGESLSRTSRQIGRAVTPDDVAAFAYAAADAMLAQREKTP